MDTDADVLARVDAAFGSVVRPEHFTNYQHCEECAEHDQTLRERDRATLGLDELGNPGWDPLCFCSAHGKAYYFPTLARLSLQPPRNEYDWYGEQLLFHLYSGGAENEFLQYCSPPQCAAVASLLGHWVATRSQLFMGDSTADELLRTHELWFARSAA